MVDNPTVSDSQIPFHHVPVLPQIVLEGLQIVSGGQYLDATVGGGGHSAELLAMDATLKLVAVDQDALALNAAQSRLAPYSDRVTFQHSNFAEFRPEGTFFDGILADLGVSSAQLDLPERGFSFRHEAPLDMRMDQRQDLTAAEIINHWEEAELARIFFVYGEERLSRRIARTVVAQRPFQTTTDLAQAIARCVPARYRHGRIHPATRSFQALRIAVNAELDVLETFLSQAPDWLVPGGRLVVISFHSLEDRIVKRAFRGDDRLKIITKKPLIATEEEIRANPRARSAKLRVAERC
ncbi:MAG: 16S rRNA (cytosine(1402)-N(4))-methyltransferase RsmH [Leptolyngbya sp. SIO1E4]|nr:16S rRNA (cytosine(1402)-N(4))-methyltransferase RsmH [Leptolyngbya sp. SIO1E4]